LPFSTVRGRKGTSMAWAPRASRQFDISYCSQESQETVSSQSRSVYGDQTAHGSNVIMDQQSFLRYQETETSRSTLLSRLMCVLRWIFFIHSSFQPLVQYTPVCLVDSPPLVSILYPPVSWRFRSLVRFSNRRTSAPWLQLPAKQAVSSRMIRSKSSRTIYSGLHQRRKRIRQ
jgi:hypothetical protein